MIIVYSEDMKIHRNVQKSVFIISRGAECVFEVNFCALQPKRVLSLKTATTSSISKLRLAESRISVLRWFQYQPLPILVHKGLEFEILKCMRVMVKYTATRILFNLKTQSTFCCVDCRTSRPILSHSDVKCEAFLEKS